MTIQILVSDNGAMNIRTAGSSLTLQETLLAAEMIRDEVLKQARGTGGFNLGLALEPRKLP